MGLVSDVTVDVAVDLARAAEDDRQRVVAAVLQHVKGHGDVFERSRRLLDKLVNLGVVGEVDDGVEFGRVGDMTQAAAEVAEGSGKVLQQGEESIGPRVRPHIHAKDSVTTFEQVEGQVGANLAAGAGNENAHGIVIAVDGELGVCTSLGAPAQPHERRARSDSG